MKTYLSEFFERLEATSLSNKEEIRAGAKHDLNVFINYFNTVVSEAVYYSTTPKDDLNTYMMKNYDETRREEHNRCVQACFELNKYCEQIGFPKICDFELEDRHKIAEFCGFVVSSFYYGNIGIERSFDDLVQEFAHNVPDDDEAMEARFRMAVEIAKAKARAKGKPVAGYDTERGEAYVEYPDGRRVYYPNIEPVQNRNNPS